MKNKTKKIITAGSLVIECVYPRVTRTDSQKVRAAKHKASSEAQRRMNKIYSYEKLELMLAANFRPGDLVITLTYDDKHLPPNRKTAEARLRYFRQKLTKLRKTEHQDMRMVWNTESRHGDGRYHHHIVLNSTGEDFSIIRELWLYGADIHIDRLQIEGEKSYESLARYMCKEEPERVGQRTWSYTRNCLKPEVETFRVEDDTTVQAPKGATVLAEKTERTQYAAYKIVKYLAPGWQKRRQKTRRRRKN